MVSVCYGKKCGLGEGSQPSNLARQSFPCGHISLEEIRQPGSDVPVSSLPTQPHGEAINTQMQGLTLRVVSGTLCTTLGGCVCVSVKIVGLATQPVFNKYRWMEEGTKNRRWGVGRGGGRKER